MSAAKATGTAAAFAESNRNRSTFSQGPQNQTKATATAAPSHKAPKKETKHPVHRSTKKALKTKHPIPRPYTEYTIFFRLERYFLVQSAGIIDEEIQPLLDPNHHDPVEFPRPPRYAGLSLPPYWYSSSTKAQIEKKRKHRKREGDSRLDMKSLSKTISAEWRKADPSIVQYCRKLAEADMRWYNEKMDRFLAEEQRQRDKEDTKTIKTVALGESRPSNHPMQLPSRRSVALPVVDGVLISPEDHPDKYYQMVHQMMNARDTASARYKTSSDVNAAGVLLSIQGQEPQEKMQRLMPGQSSHGFNGKGAPSSHRADGTHAMRTQVPPFVLHAAAEAATRHMQHQRPPPSATLNRNSSSSLGYQNGYARGFEQHPPSAAPNISMMNRYSTSPSLHPPTPFNRHHSFPSSRGGPPTLSMAMTLAKELCDLEAASRAEVDTPFSPDMLRRMSNEELLALSNSLKLRRVGGSLGQQPSLGNNRSVGPRGSVGDTTDMHELPKPSGLGSLARPTSPGTSSTAMNGSMPMTEMPRLISNTKSPPALPKPSNVLSDGSYTKKKRNADRLTIPMDDKVLDAVNIYVRKYCIQLFEEVLADDAKPVVGFHCYYCKELSQDGSHDHAKWYLKDYNTIFEKVRDYQQHHLNTCPCFPQELKARYHSLIQQEYWNQKKTSSPAFLRAYYAEAAAELGLVESPHGLMFSSEPEESGKASARLQSLVGLIG